MRGRLFRPCLTCTKYVRSSSRFVANTNAKNEADQHQQRAALFRWCCATTALLCELLQHACSPESRLQITGTEWTITSRELVSKSTFASLERTHRRGLTAVLFTDWYVGLISCSFSWLPLKHYSFIAHLEWWKIQQEKHLSTLSGITFRDWHKERNEEIC